MAPCSGMWRSCCGPRLLPRGAGVRAQDMSRVRMGAAQTSYRFPGMFDRAPRLRVVIRQVSGSCRRRYFALRPIPLS